VAEHGLDVADVRAAFEHPVCRRFALGKSYYSGIVGIRFEREASGVGQLKECLASGAAMQGSRHMKAHSVIGMDALKGGLRLDFRAMQLKLD
jgi:hypothetical protein